MEWIAHDKQFVKINNPLPRNQFSSWGLRTKVLKIYWHINGLSDISNEKYLIFKTIYSQESTLLLWCVILFLASLKSSIRFISFPSQFVSNFIKSMFNSVDSVIQTFITSIYIIPDSLRA